MVPELVVPLLPVVGTYVIHSTILLGGTWLLLLCWPRASHAARELLWKLAAIAPVLTTAVQCSFLGAGSFSIELTRHEAVPPECAEPDFPDPVASRPIRSSMSLEPRRSPAAEIDETPRHPSSPGTHVESHEPQRGLPSVEPGPEHHAAAAAESLAAHELTDSSERRSVWPYFFGLDVRLVFRLLFCMALGVTAWGGLRFILSSLAFRRHLARCAAYRGRAREVLNELLRQNSPQRKVELLAWDHAREPAAMGFFRWRIIIPAQADRQLKREDLRAMLAHELAHLVRRDPFWQWLGRLLCSVAAFQPLNCVAWKRWRRAAEFQCDAWAVQSGVTRLALARCLTAIAEWRHVQPIPQPVLGSSAGSGDLSDRVERLLDRKPLPTTPSRGAKAKRLACVAILLGLSCVALPHLESKAEIVDADPGVQPEHSPPVENPCTFADPASGAQVVLRELRNLDQEIIALRNAAHTLQDHPSTSENPDSLGLPTQVLARLETIERLRNDLAQLSARLANERTEK